MKAPTKAGARVLARMRETGEIVKRGWVGCTWHAPDGKDSLHQSPHPAVMEALERQGHVTYRRTDAYAGEWSLPITPNGDDDGAGTG